jgi:hypothetical protein
MNCFLNCDKEVLDDIGQANLKEIAGEIPELSLYFLNDKEGQLTEKVINDVGVPKF